MEMPTNHPVLVKFLSQLTEAMTQKDDVIPMSFDREQLEDEEQTLITHGNDTHTEGATSATGSTATNKHK